MNNIFLQKIFLCCRNKNTTKKINRQKRQLASKYSSTVITVINAPALARACSSPPARCVYTLDTVRSSYSSFRSDSLSKFVGVTLTQTWCRAASFPLIYYNSVKVRPPPSLAWQLPEEARWRKIGQPNRINKYRYFSVIWLENLYLIIIVIYWYTISRRYTIQSWNAAKASIE